MGSSYVRAAALLALLSAGACSSIVEGTTQTLTVTSDPEGADCVLVRNGATLARVKTPAQVEVDRTKYDITVACTKDGHEDGAAVIRSGISTSTFGNFVSGGIGSLIDSMFGADNRYTKTTIVSLDPR